MVSSKLISCLFFLSTIALLVQTVISLNPLFHNCSEGNFVPGSPYEENLISLLTDINLKTPPTGFSTSSIGEKPDRTHGLSLCRGDVTSNDCKTCVLDASEEIGRQCPYTKGAIIWYDNCLLKYSEDCFKGEIDYVNKFNWWNSTDSNPETFKIFTQGLIGCLAERAYSVPSFFATREMEIVNDEKLYGLVQCTRDLTKEDCKKCLDGIIAEIPKSDFGNRGGRVDGGSCNFRYETYPFFNSLQKLEVEELLELNK